MISFCRIKYLTYLLLILILLVTTNSTITTQDDTATNTHEETTTIATPLTKKDEISIPKGISYKKLLSLIHTESNKEFYTKSILNDDDTSKLWKLLTDFEWKLIHDHDSTSISSSNKYSDDGSSSNNPNKYHSFIMCKGNNNENDDAALSSQDRHEQILNHISNKHHDNDKAYIQPLYVKPNETCYILYTTYNKCKELSKKDKHVKLQPMSYSMKILSGSIDIIDELWRENEKEQQDEQDEDFNQMEKVMEFKSSHDDTTFSTSDSNTDTAASSKKKKKDNIKKPFLTIDIALCPNNYEKIYKEIIHYHHYIRKTILEYALDIEKLKEHFFWFHYDNDTDDENDANEISERSIFWKNILNEKKTCRSIYNDITISFDNDIPVKSSSKDKDEKVSIPIIKITFPRAEHKSCIYQFLLSLSLQKCICTIQVQSKLNIFNHNIQWLVQTGVKNEIPWYDKHIDGTNQVIGISDTGIDMDHCYFKNNNTSSLHYGEIDTIDLDQRKIIQYDDFVNKVDYKYGHGTHVVGSTIGLKNGDFDVSSLNTIDPGIAPNAKVAFIDIGTDDGALILPSISRVLQTGSPYAKIHSASWGNTYNTYGLYSMQFDSYVYNTDDELLPVVAAGKFM